MNPSLVEVAENLLAKALGWPVPVAAVRSLPSPHLLLRCSVAPGSGLPSSLIVKQITSTEFTAAQPGAVSPRLLNEWAALRFLGSVDRLGPWPSLVAGDHDSAVVVLEDLGDIPPVLDTLLGPDPAHAIDALANLGRSLGHLHTTAHGRTDEFAATQTRLGAASPASDSTHRLPELAGRISEALEDLGVTPRPGFWEEAADVAGTIHAAGPLRTVIHADAGPQNFLWGGGSASLVDFEFTTIGHAFADLVSARLGFPHTEHAAGVPLSAVETVEDAWRTVAAPVIPTVDDDRVFATALTDACAHWALVRAAYRFRPLFHTATIPDRTLDPQRAQAYTVLAGFVSTAERTGHREALAATVDHYMKALRRRFSDLDVSPAYPALSRGGGVLP